jgi:hypothetical protein
LAVNKVASEHAADFRPKCHFLMEQQSYREKLIFYKPQVARVSADTQRFHFDG